MNFNIKKLFLTAALTAVVSVAAFAQAGNAATVANPTDDFTAYVPSGYDSSTALDSLLVNKIFNNDILVSFIKFDISALKGQAISGAKISLFGSGAQGTSASIYYVANDAWVDQNVSKSSVDLAALQGSLLAMQSITTTNNVNEFVFSDLNDLVANLSNPADNYFSVVVKANYSFNNAAFFSQESAFAPKLEVTPVPEPSSMLLGLMGLSSMLGLRRKKSA